MAQKATRYKRIIFQSNGITVVPIGRGGRQDCTTLPDDAAELRRLIAAGPNSGGDVFCRGPGDEFILNNPCVVKYYLGGKLITSITCK